MPIRLVLFDLWGTLIVDDPAITERRRLMRISMTVDALAAGGMPFPETAVEDAFLRADREHGEVHNAGRDLTAEGRTILYVRHIDETLPDRLDDRAWQALHDAILTPARTAKPALIAGARDALAAVKAAGLPAGLVSNAGITPGFVLREILEAYGLWPHFDDAIFSDEVELAKPTAAIFEHALDAFDVRPSDAVFVGDQPVLDVLGPQSAGLWTIQVGDLSDEGIEPHVRIASVVDIMQGLDALERVIAAAGAPTH